MKMFRYAYIVLALLLGLGFGAHIAYAGFGEDLIENQKTQLESYSDELSYDKFLSNSDLYQEKPKGDKYLEYSVRLPKKWERYSDRFDYLNKAEEEAGLKRRILGKVSEYHGPQRIMGTSRFEVYAEDLQFEITAENWIVDMLLRRGYALQGVQSQGREKAVVEYVVFLKDTPYVVRSVAQVTGRRIVVASYFCPDAYWKYERPYQQYAVESFKLTNPERVKIAPTKKYAFLDLLQFEYPSSWRLIAPNIYSIDGMEAKLVRSVDEKTLEGEIGINVYSTKLNTTLAKELSYVREALDFLGLKVGDFIESRTDEYEFGDHVFFQKIEVYEAVHKQGAVQPHEYWVAILKESRYYYIISMVTPSRNMEYYSWARNVEAFKTIIETLGPYEYGEGGPGFGTIDLDEFSSGN